MKKFMFGKIFDYNEYENVIVKDREGKDKEAVRKTGNVRLGKMFAHVIIFLLAIVTLMNSFVIINPGERGIVVTMGKMEDYTLAEGFHTIQPFTQNIIKVDTRVQTYKPKETSYSNDTQTIDLALSVNYAVKPTVVNKLYREVGMDYQNKLVVSNVDAKTKEIVAKYLAQDVLPNREKLGAEVALAVKNSIPTDYFTVTLVNIDNIDFSDKYEESVEQKQIAQQNALKAENDLKRVQFEAEQRVAQAKAEAEAIKIQAQAITQQGGKDYVNLKWIEAWQQGGSKVPDTIIGNSAGSNFLFDLKQEQTNNNK